MPTQHGDQISDKTIRQHQKNLRSNQHAFSNLLLLLQSLIISDSARTKLHWHPHSEQDFIKIIVIFNNLQ